MTYFLRERGFYVNRLYALIVIAVFIGSMYLNLETHTDQITLYAGAMFFATFSCMLTAVSATGLLAKNRYEAVDRVSNGVYTPFEFVIAQMTAAAIYDLAVIFVYVCIYHWMTNLSPNKECFIYDIAINWGHLMVMESVLLVVIEILKNDFLSTTFGMIFIGTNMGFAGFFRRITDIPIWIRWMCYIVPLRWSFDGFIWQIFRTQSFKVTGTPYSIQGTEILASVFDLHNIDSWGLWIALLGYVVLFRFTQWFLFALQTGTLPKRLTQEPKHALDSSELELILEW
jgi:hypothetical protein